MTPSHLSITYNGGERRSFPLGKTTFEEAFYVDASPERTVDGGVRWQVFIHPKPAKAGNSTFNLEAVELVFDYTMPDTGRMLCNGWQSWSETQWLTNRDRIAPISPILRPFIGASGDYSFYPTHTPNSKRQHQRGRLHSWTYTALATDTHALLGSLNEQSGFTVFEYDHAAATLTAKKDVSGADGRGLQLEHSYPALDIFLSTAPSGEAYDHYFKAYFEGLKENGITPHRINETPYLHGWTSWYYHYNRISAAIILENADAMRTLLAERHAIAAPTDTTQAVVQIDDGWQTHVGDWWGIREGFGGNPEGMQRVAEGIRAQGFTAGLWLAPFVAERGSQLFAQHPDWLLRDSAGQPVRAGFAPIWSGSFYALDIYHPEAAAYITDALLTASAKWGFALLKLDFLYAAALYPPPHRTRGQVMHDAVALITAALRPTGARWLACGIPLAAAFGTADYCRIGADTHTAFEHRFLAWMHVRERVSTRAALRSTVARHPLDGRAFRSDADVFILRDRRHRLTVAERDLLLTTNTLLGSVFFTSDPVAAYSRETRAQYLAALGAHERLANGTLTATTIPTDEGAQLSVMDTTTEDHKKEVFELIIP